MGIVGRGYLLITFGSERVNCLRIKQKKKRKKEKEREECLFGPGCVLIWAGVSTLNFECKLWRRFQKESLRVTTEQTHCSKALKLDYDRLIPRDHCYVSRGHKL